jgi:hypothetical protein
MEIPSTTRNRLSIIDHREINKVNPSIIDRYTYTLQKRLSDPTLDSRFIAKVVQNLSEAEIEDLADYVCRKATQHKGKAFVKLCSNVMQYKVAP